MQCSYIPANDRGEGKGGGGERRRGRQEKKWGEVRLGGEREESKEGNHPWVEWPEHSTGEEMKGMIWRGRLRGWEETTLREKWGGRLKGVNRGGIKEKSVEALYREKITRGGREREGRHGRGDSLSFVRIFWEHGLSAVGCFICP